MFQDIALLARRQKAGAGLNLPFQQGETALAGRFAGGGVTQNWLPVARGSALPDLNAQLGFNALSTPHQTGCLIPAMIVSRAPAVASRRQSTSSRLSSVAALLRNGAIRFA